MTDKIKTIADRLQEILFQHGAVSVSDAAPGEIYRALGYYVRETLGSQLYETDRKIGKKKGRVIVYLSMEHLPGLMLKKNLDYLGMYEDIEKALKDLGWDLEELLAEDRELGLGYSDMGHLANSLLDTFASGGYSAIGYGLLYREGYFRQAIVDGQQIEEPDIWWSRGKNWLYKSTHSYNAITGGTVDISMDGKELVFTQKGGDVHTLRYYDLPYAGWGNSRSLRLRLLDHDTLTRRLIPLNSMPEKKRLRFKQEYLLVSGAMQDIVRQHLEKGRPIDMLDEHYLFLMTDSHLLLGIPELLRILMDDTELSWDEAWDITSRAFYYAPISTIEEAMNTIEGNMIREWLPRLWLILEEIHHRYLARLGSGNTLQEDGKRSQGILWDNEVRLVNIAKAGAYQGAPLGHPVAVSHRRWLLSGNPELRELIVHTIGNGFISKPKEISELSKYANDTGFLHRLEEVKLKNKKRLAIEVYKNKGILLDPYAMFDGHLRDINEDNRQLMQILWIIDAYLHLKDDPNLDVVPRVVFIAGRAMEHDTQSKLQIQLFNRLADKINKDLTIKDKLRLLFVEDLSQRRGELLIPALDMVQSLTVPSKGGLHLGGLVPMINGAVALGSRDSTNLLIKRHAGSGSINLFGITGEEAQMLYDFKDSNPQELYYRNKYLKRACEILLGKEAILDSFTFKSLNENLLKYNDHSFVLRDFTEYNRAMDELSKLYIEKDEWNRRALGSILLTADFSADHVVEIYAGKMWQKQTLEVTGIDD